MAESTTGAHRGILDDDGNILPAPTPTEAELKDAYSAPGRQALLPIGIAYHGPWKIYGDGMGRHCREQVRALAAAGMPVRLQSMSFQRLLNDDLHPDVRDVSYLESVSMKHTAFSIKQFIFHGLTQLREQICPSAMRGAFDMLSKHTIIYTSWERDRVFSEYIEELKGTAQLWVPCEANRKAFISSGLPEEKVRVMPYPFDPDKHTIAAPRGSEGAPDGLRFYHIGKWEPRKNQHQLLGAFLLAFFPKDQASLFVKTSEYRSMITGYPSPEESLEFWSTDPEVKARGWTPERINKRIRIVTRKVPEKDIREIHNRNNIYVSSGLGEAWDIPAFDAKLAGNRLVYVGFGGPEDYAQPEDVQVPHKFGPVDKSYRWEPDAQWADVSIEDFAMALKRAKPPEIRVMPAQFHARFSRYAVGKRMREEILKLATPEAAHQLVEAGGFG